jgi:hypothetical protein
VSRPPISGRVCIVHARSQSKLEVVGVTRNFFIAVSVVVVVIGMVVVEVKLIGAV